MAEKAEMTRSFSFLANTLPMELMLDIQRSRDMTRSFPIEPELFRYAVCELFVRDASCKRVRLFDSEEIGNFLEIGAELVKLVRHPIDVSLVHDGIAAGSLATWMMMYWDKVRAGQETEELEGLYSKLEPALWLTDGLRYISVYRLGHECIAELAAFDQDATVLSWSEFEPGEMALTLEQELDAIFAAI